MGTSVSGRYMNTEGSGKKVSDFALVHSNEGGFIRAQTRADGRTSIKLRLASGGHGQKGMDLLDKYGIEYNVVKTYSNGVRVGNVPWHVQRNKRTGIAQSWFPKTWTDKDIRCAGEYIAEHVTAQMKSDKEIIYGKYQGVKVGVMLISGKIESIFPDSIQ